MGNIRKQTIVSSILVYFGFLIGLINTYFYIKNGTFTTEQYGLTKIFMDFGQNMCVFASVGTIPVIYKFYPYYKDNIEDQKNDLLTWAFVASFIGFIIVIAAGIVFEPLFIRKYTRTSPLIVTYYYWMFPLALGILYFTLLESFCWAIQKTILSNFLKETFLRILTLLLILLFYFKLISFQSFVYVFAFLYIVLCLVMMGYLHSIDQLHFTFNISIVTKKFWKKMVSMQVLIFGGTIIITLATTIDSFVIAGFNGLSAVGVFTLAQYVSNLIQVPQRSIQAVSAGALSRAWKDKNLGEINRIYQRSCINLLIIALFIFGNVWLNIKQGLILFDVQKEYEAGLETLFILSIARIIDAGTGVNNFVISTSIRWRFEFMSGIILLGIRLPLTWLFIKQFGIIGSAFADIIAITVYNCIRFEFLRRTYNMQPFTIKNLYAIILAMVAYYTAFYLPQVTGFIGMIERTSVFSVIIIVGVYYLKLTPDAQQLIHSLKARLITK
jgi:O-antigen/teichoic acid export membrane protein